MIEEIDYTVNKINLSEQIADTLEQAIINSDIKAEKLPPEQELSGRFKVSRTVIREALKILKERGLIDSRSGGGSYLSRPNTDSISSVLNRIIRMDNISSDDLHNMRLILETAAARLAALNIRLAEIKHLEFIMEQMTDETMPMEMRINLEADFHVTIARSSRNELVGMFVEVMIILLKDYTIKGVFGSPGIRRSSGQYRRIAEALKRRDPTAAEAAIQEHLAASRKNAGEYEAAQKPRPKLIKTEQKTRAGFRKNPLPAPKRR